MNCCKPKRYVVVARGGLSSILVLVQTRDRARLQAVAVTVPRTDLHPFEQRVHVVVVDQRLRRQSLRSSPERLSDQYLVRIEESHQRHDGERRHDRLQE